MVGTTAFAPELSYTTVRRNNQLLDSSNVRRAHDKTDLKNSEKIRNRSKKNTSKPARRSDVGHLCLNAASVQKRVVSYILHIDDNNNNDRQLISIKNLTLIRSKY